MKTKRGDMPASPVVRKTEHKENRDIVFDATEGMTIRERFAMAAMQALLSNPSITRGERRNTPGLAVRHADALLAELERTKDQQ